MSKEKTRAELHAEVADLKAKLENEVKHATEVRAEYANLDDAHKALRSEHEACEKSLERADKVIEEMNAEIERLKKREEYLEGSIKIGQELVDKKSEEVKSLYATIERIRADRDKYMYLANNLMEHGVFHFLIVKYRNLKNIAGNGDGCHKGEGRTE